MKDARHIVFDLETLGNGPTAPIIQIGAVEYVNGKMTRQCELNVKYESFEGFTPDYSTIMWWMNQSDGARIRITNEAVAIYLPEALSNFIQWVGDTDNTLFWSMSNFDAPILRHAFKQMNIPEFPFRQFRDFRTIINAAGLERGQFEGVKHYALDDARNEGDLIMKAIYPSNTPLIDQIEISFEEDVDEKLTKEQAIERVSQIASVKLDNEGAHSMEDDLFLDFVKSVSLGLYSTEEAKSIALEVLKSKDLEFSRWCA